MKENDQNSRLFEEGKSYDFEIRKMVKLSDEQNYYVMIDPFGKRHLMFDSDYNNYGIKTGDVISCKIDKINCNGKIFLEPKHPYYSEGKTYKFEIGGCKEVENSKKEIEKVFLINDEYNSTAQIINLNASSYDSYVGKKIHAKIDRIKKARLYLCEIK